MTNEPKKNTTKRKIVESPSKSAPSYVLSVEVDNVLCFKDRQVLNLCNPEGLPAQWTVILGDNGVGKTTLLRCLAGMELGHTIANANSPSITLPLLWRFQSSLIWDELQILEKNNSVIVVQFASGQTLKSFYNHDKKSQIVFLKSKLELTVDKHFTQPQGNTLLEVHFYGYGATRKMGKTSLSDTFSLTNHSESLFSDTATLINAEEWILQTDYAIKSSSNSNQKRFQKQLNQIIEVLQRILPDVENIRIAPRGRYGDSPKAEFLTAYGWVGLSSLGLGYRTMIAWMVDLAVRLFKRYPDSEDPLAEPAIVLVDEIDLHLHPKWQRTIMEFLTERFPNTQFIVTAHSPLVVQAAQDANIVLLRREGDRVVIDNNPEIIENWRVDQVLTSVFEMPSARPIKIEPWLKRRKEILTQPELTESDRLELKELEEKIGTLPTAQNPEDIKAMDIIRRAAKLLENS